MDPEELKKVSGGETNEELQPYDSDWIRTLIRLYRKSRFTIEDVKTNSCFDISGSIFCRAGTSIDPQTRDQKSRSDRAPVFLFAVTGSICRFFAGMMQESDHPVLNTEY